MGSLFSSFCWHVEDQFLYSINFLHEGQAKTWYGIPGGYGQQFHDLLKEKIVPELFHEEPNLLEHLITMIGPAELVSHGVPVCRAVQEKGEFIVTFPRAYHAGFNNGFNCAEAVNFATADWLPWCAKAIDKMSRDNRAIYLLSREGSLTHTKVQRKRPTFFLDELLLTLAKDDGSPTAKPWYANHIRSLAKVQLGLSQKLQHSLRSCKSLSQGMPPWETPMLCRWRTMMRTFTLNGTATCVYEAVGSPTSSATSANTT